MVLVLIPLLLLATGFAAYEVYVYRREQNTRHLLETAQQAVAAKDYQAAGVAYRQYLQRRPSDRAALNAYADVLFEKMGAQPEVAADLMRTLQRLTGLEPDNLVALSRLTELCFRYGEYAVTEELAGNWARRDPSSVKAVTLLVQARVALNRPAEAAELLKQALERLPGEPTLHAQLVMLTAFDLKDLTQAEAALNRGLQAAAHSSDLHLAGFHLLRARGDVDGARRHLDEALGLAPDSMDALLTGIAYFSEIRDLGRARELLDRAHRQAPDDDRVWLAQVEYVNRTGDRNLTIETADALASRAGDGNPVFLIHAADLNLRVQRLGETDECLKRLEAMPRAVERKNLSSAVDTVKGVRALLGGDPLTAIRFLREAVGRQPDHPRSAKQLALAFWEGGDLAAAADVLERLLATSPPDIEARMQLVEIRWQLDQPARARELVEVAPKTGDEREWILPWIITACRFREAQGNENAGPSADSVGQWRDVKWDGVLGLAPARWALRCLLFSNQDEAVTDLLDRALEDPSAGPRLALEAGAYLLARRRGAEAMALGDKVANRCPDSVEGNRLRLRAQAELGRWDEAAKIPSACALPQKACAQLWEALGDEYLSADRTEDALIAFRQALSRGGGDVSALVKVIESTEHLDEALASAESLRAREGDEGHRWKFSLARSILRLDQKGEHGSRAKELLEQCLTDRPRWVTARLLLGFALERLNQPDKAVEQYQNALAQEPVLYGKPVGIRLVGLLESLGRYAEADTVLSAVANAMPGHPDLLQYQTRRFVRQRDFDSAVATAEQLLKVKPDDPSQAALTAELHLRVGHQDRAEAVARESLSTFPQSLPALRALVRVLAAGGKEEIALSEVRRAVDQFQDAPHYVLLAQLMAEMKQTAEAEQAMGKAVQASPDDPGVWMACAEVWGQLGRANKRLDFVRKAVELRGDDPNSSLVIAEWLAVSPDEADRRQASAIVERRWQADPDDDLTLVLKARLALSSDPPDRNTAHDALQRAILASPGNVLARKLLAGVQIDRGQPAEALSTIETALFYAPDDVQLLVTSARIHGHRGDFDRAIPVLRRALEIQPRSIDALRLIATAYRQGGQIDRAIASLEQAAPHGSRTPEELLLLAELYESNQQLESAQALLEQSLRIDPVASETFARVFTYFVRRGDCQRVADLAAERFRAVPDDARSQLSAADLLGGPCGQDPKFRALADQGLERVISERPEHTADALFIQGMGHYQHGRLAEAESSFLRAVQHTPIGRDAVNALAWLYAVDLNRPQEARTALDRFMAAGGHEDARLLDTHATVFLRLGDTAAAKRKLDECLRIVGQSSTRAAAHYHMGLVLQAEGRENEATGHIRRALELADQFGGLTDQERQEGLRLVNGHKKTTGELPD